MSPDEPTSLDESVPFQDKKVGNEELDQSFVPEESFDDAIGVCWGLLDPV
jgi:hypothetical protein